MPTVSGVIKSTSADLEKELAPLVERALERPGELTLADLEDETLLGLVAVGRGFLERLSAARSGEEGREIPSRSVAGATLEYKGQKQRKVQTTFGKIAYWRAYYRNQELGESCWPRDEELGLKPREPLSPRLQEVSAYLSTVTGSYDKGTEVLAKLRRIELQYKQAQREVLKIGAKLEAKEKRVHQEIFEQDQRPDVPNVGTEAILIGCDGITTPHCAGGDMEIKVGRVERVALQPASSENKRRKRVRPRRDALGRPVEARSRRGELGSEKKSQEQLEYEKASDVVETAIREAYPERRKQPKFQRTTEHSDYQATARLGPETLGRAMWLAALSLGLGLRTLVLFVADGSTWCWNLATTFFPGAVQILDAFHLASHVVKAANAIWGKRSKAAREWRHRVMVELLRGEVDAVLAELAKLSFLDKSKQEAKQGLIRYLKRNRERMDYPSYVEGGYPIGSSRIESACRQVIGDRMKGNGRRWDDDGGDAMARLRAIECSGRWEEALANRTRQATEATLALVA